MTAEHKPTPLTYATAGVDVDAGNRSVALIRDIVTRTHRPGVQNSIGGFASLFAIPNLSQYTAPLLLSSTDGVGTKLKIAIATDELHSVGQDLVAMCVNDILVYGGEPLFFLDYLASSKIVPEQVARIVEGIADACVLAGCALVGGETAELSGFYAPGDFDMAGFVVGVVDAPKLIDGQQITPGDLLFGLPSSGLHSNGFTLVRQIVAASGLSYDDPAPWDTSLTVGRSLLTPTKIYVPLVRTLLQQLPGGTIKGMAHLTGGGFIDNIPRVLPAGCSAQIELGSWPVPPVFSWLQREGAIEQTEMYRTFNNGIAYILVIAPQDLPAVRAALADQGEAFYTIGEIVAGDGSTLLKED